MGYEFSICPPPRVYRVMEIHSSFPQFIIFLGALPLFSCDQERLQLMVGNVCIKAGD